MGDLWSPVIGHSKDLLEQIRACRDRGAGRVGPCGTSMKRLSERGSAQLRAKHTVAARHAPRERAQGRVSGWRERCGRGCGAGESLEIGGTRAQGRDVFIHDRG
jgi:hypothetical protein